MAHNSRKKLKLSLFTLAIGILFATACNNSSTETQQQASVDSAKTIPTQPTREKILFFGNSLTAGYGLEQDEAFPARIQAKIDSLNLPYEVVNAGLSGETSAGGLTRIDWILQQKPAVFVLELGANDGLRGIPVTETRKNLQAILDKVKQANDDCKLIVAGMMVPPNMGAAYSKSFTGLFPALAKENNAVLIPFLLEGVAGETNLNQADGIHPTAEGHQLVANAIWKYIQPVLGGN